MKQPINLTEQANFIIILYLSHYQFFNSITNVYNYLQTTINVSKRLKVGCGWKAVAYLQCGNGINILAKAYYKESTITIDILGNNSGTYLN